MSLKTTIQQLAEFDTALLANTIGYIDPTPPHEYYMGGSIRSLTPSLGPTAGVAFTCEVDTSTPGGESVMDGFYQQLDEMERLGAPSIWVAKAVGSRPDHECVMGDGTAKLLYSAGCIGAVSDGGLRDINGLLTIPFAAYARGPVIHHSAMRILTINQPIQIGGIVVRPGDILHANSEGVIKIPASCAAELPERAIKMRAFEHAAHLAFRRADLSGVERRGRVTALLAEYGFK